MKKFLVIPLLVISSGLFAQGFQLGVKGGVNISNFSGSSSAADVKKKAYIGFHAGAMLGFQAGNHFTFQPEVLFSSQGAKYKSAGGDQNFKVAYINVPVMFKYRFTGGFYLEAGPQVGFKISESTDNRPINNFAKDLDLAVDAGLGYHSPVGVGIGARYIVGVSKVGNFETDDLANANAKNGVAQVFVFFTLFNNHK